MLGLDACRGPHLLGWAARTRSMVSTPTPMMLTTAWPASVLARL